MTWQAWLHHQKLRTYQPDLATPSQSYSLTQAASPQERDLQWLWSHLPRLFGWSLAFSQLMMVQLLSWGFVRKSFQWFWTSLHRLCWFWPFSRTSSSPLRRECLQSRTACKLDWYSSHRVHVNLRFTGTYIPDYLHISIAKSDAAKRMCYLLLQRLLLKNPRSFQPFSCGLIAAVCCRLIAAFCCRLIPAEPSHLLELQ